MSRLGFRSSLLLVALGATLAAGCGSSSKSSSTPSATPAPKTDPKVAALVPAAVKSKGSLTVATDASYAPVEFFAADGKTVIGIDPDLGKALGGVMGIKLQFKNASFDGIIPGLQAGKYDLGMSAFTDTRAREKTVDFVTYYSAGTSAFEKAQGGPSVKALADLCGHKVSVEKGTTQQTDATAQGKKCKAAGKPGVTVLVFPDQNAANLALSSGRADVGMADSPIADYQVKKTSGQFKLTGLNYGPFPYGIAVPKKSGMTKALQAALKVLISGGQYKTILEKWGAGPGAITNPKINAAIS